MKGRVGIVGGSIAGCAAAVAAARAGCEVTVFERADDLHDRGFGVGMPVDTHEALTTAGYLDRAMRVQHAAERIWVVAEPGEAYGRVLWSQPCTALAVNWGQLWQTLAARVPPGSYRTGQVTDIRRTGVVVLEDGQEHDFDLVIGADGHRSLVRSTLHPGVRPARAGYFIWRGIVPEANLPGALITRLTRDFVTVVFPRGHAVFYLIPTEPSGRLLNWVVYGTPDRRHAGMDQVWPIVERFLPPAWAQVCRHTTVLTVHPVADLTIPSYAAAPFLLAGDAATLARPHTASGAVKALLDAHCLERALTAGSTWQHVFAAYDAERRPAGNQLVEIGRRIGHAQVDNTPRWASMTPREMRSWAESLLSGHEHYLYQGNPTATPR